MEHLYKRMFLEEWSGNMGILELGSVNYTVLPERGSKYIQLQSQLLFYNYPPLLCCLLSIYIYIK